MMGQHPPETPATPPKMSLWPLGGELSPALRSSEEPRPGEEAQLSAPPPARIVASAQIWRDEKLPLQLATDSMHGSRADLGLAGKLVRNGAQERVAQFDRQRPGGIEDGVQLGVVQFDRRHGAHSHC